MEALKGDARQVFADILARRAGIKAHARNAFSFVALVGEFEPITDLKKQLHEKMHTILGRHIRQTHRLFPFVAMLLTLEPTPLIKLILLWARPCCVLLTRSE